MKKLLAFAVLSVSLALAACGAEPIGADDDPIGSTTSELKVIKKHQDCMDNCFWYFGQDQIACFAASNCKVTAPTGPNTNTSSACQECLDEADEKRDDCEDFCHVYFPW